MGNTIGQSTIKVSCCNRRVNSSAVTSVSAASAAPPAATVAPPAASAPPPAAQTESDPNWLGHLPVRRGGPKARARAAGY